MKSLKVTFLILSVFSSTNGFGKGIFKTFQNLPLKLIHIACQKIGSQSSSSNFIQRIISIGQRLQEFKIKNPGAGGIFYADGLLKGKSFSPTLNDLQRDYDDELSYHAMLVRGFSDVAIKSVEDEPVSEEIPSDPSEQKCKLSFIRHIIFYNPFIGAKRRSLRLKEATSADQPSTYKLLQDYEETYAKILILKYNLSQWKVSSDEYKELEQKNTELVAQLDSRIVPEDFVGAVFDPYKLEAEVPAGRPSTAAVTLKTEQKGSQSTNVNTEIQVEPQV